MNYGGKPPLIAHVIHHLGTGGLENGLVNIINRTPPVRYRHAIVCLSTVAEFATRITVPDVSIIELHRNEGHSFGLYLKLWRALQHLRPALIHTRNLSTLEMQLPAALVSGARRVHGEHGRDLFDLHGENRKYNLLRRAIRPLVQRYIPVSQDLADWLQQRVGVEQAHIRQIYNGVDQTLFTPRNGSRPDISPRGFLPKSKDALVFGTVGRLAGVKDQSTLVRAFGQLVRDNPEISASARLVIVGDGPDREKLEGRVRSEGLVEHTWLAGERHDIPLVMRLLDVFVLPSLGRGIANPVVEAMARGRPIIATRVGGNPELVEEGNNGFLTPAADPDAMARAMTKYLDHPDLVSRQGKAGRGMVEHSFNWSRCVEDYLGVYDELLRN